ncbi:MAG: TIGR04066 family peptide maturation system protein [Clostridia bacterium]|nr:TIGR04066 family peptide maturation system protein [Clostridia bacterium]
MNNKEKLVVYPYDLEFTPILRHKELLRDFEITGIVSPKGWGLEGRDAGFTDKGSKLNITVESRLENVIYSCDTVLITESLRKFDFEKLVMPNIVLAVKEKKNIICSLRLEEHIHNRIKRLCEEEGISFRYCYNSETQPLKPDIEHIKEIRTPVIFVLGVAERTHKFHIQLALREQLSQMGYKVGQIGSRRCCELMEFHSFPYFMYSKGLSETEKIMLFNNFVKEIELKEKPDVIIIGIPGGIMPFNKEFSNHFGIFAYEVSQAVIPDAVIFSTLYEDYLPYYFELMNSTVKYKLGFDIDCFNLSNIQLDWNKSTEDKKLSFVTVDSGFIENKKDKLSAANVQIYNVLNQEDEVKIAEFLVDRLSCREEAECI